MVDLKTQITTNANKPKLLFLDDRTKRREYAEKEYGISYDVTCVSCVPEALRYMCSHEWNIISLDHDLMGVDFQDPDMETTGMEIVRYLEKCGGWPTRTIAHKTPDFWIHSSNLFAAHLMIVRLEKMGFHAHQKGIRYPVENMKYDKEGLPI